MLPPRYWPTQLWVAVGAACLLLLHAIGLGVQLLLGAVTDGVPSEPYVGQVITGFVPALAVLIVGAFAALSLIRDTNEALVAWGRVVFAALGVIVVALICLTLPLLQNASRIA